MQVLEADGIKSHPSGLAEMYGVVRELLALTFLMKWSFSLPKVAEQVRVLAEQAMIYSMQISVSLVEK